MRSKQYTVVQGPILAFIYAVKEMMEEGQATQTALPVNVAFVFEGEEENGQSAYCSVLAILCAARAACDWLIVHAWLL